MLGGFRPTHLVTVAVAVCAASVLAPVASDAAGSGVSIVDKINNTSVARVTAKGTVWTNLTDPITGSLGRVTSDGKQYVGDGDGALTVDLTAPKTPWNQINDITVSGSTSRATLFTAIGPTRLNLTSFTLAADGPTAGTVRVLVIVYVSDSNAGNCLTLAGASFGAAERFVVTVPVGQTTSITYPTPLVYSVYAGAGKRYCVDVEGTGPSSFVGHISASGFLT